MTTVLTEVLNIAVSDTCQSGVFLRWQNDYGGVDQWLFNGNMSEKVSISDVEYFEKNIDDLVDERSNFEVIRKTFAEGKTVYTTFDKTNTEGFKQLLRSRFIQMYIAGEWYQVDVNLVSMNVEEFMPFGKLTIDIVLPKIYVK